MKGNMFLGYARGSVGDVVFTRQKGQQVGRARNRKPANPRTISQSMQRSLFANVVKFHTKGVQQLFKFAFEDKRPAESDYNAFMRHNLTSSVRISKLASQSAVYPALGRWMMSYGSLRSPQIDMPTGSGDNVWRMKLPSATSNMHTWGDFSQCLRTDFGLLAGDIVTFIHITAIGATLSNLPAVIPPSGLQGSDWDLSQRTISSDSVESLPYGWSFDNGIMVIALNDPTTALYCQGVSLIVSRPTSRGLLVSTSYLVPNKAANSVIDACEDASYLEGVIQSWESADIAILQGSLLQESREPGNIVVSTEPSLPSSAASVTVNLSRGDFYSQVVEGQVVGKLSAGGEEYDLFVFQTGSQITLNCEGVHVTMVGMRNDGEKFRLTNEDGVSISSIIIYDI